MVINHTKSLRADSTVARQERKVVGKAFLDTNLSGTALHLLLGHLGSGCSCCGTVGLALLLLLLLLLLGLCESLSLGSSTNLGLLVTLGGNGIQAGTDDTALVLDSLAGALLGDLFGDSLLVHTTEDDGPRNLTGVLTLQEQRLALARNEAEDFAVSANVKPSLSGVDLPLRERAGLNLHLVLKESKRDQGSA